MISLRNKDKLPAFKAVVYKNSESAIFARQDYGPAFGGGSDLVIKNNAHLSSSAYTNFGFTYKPPAGYTYGTTESKTLLAGSYDFTPTEVEVYYLI